MENKLLLYPVTMMFFLIIYLYVRNFLDNIKAKNSKKIKFSYFKTYQGEVPDYIAVSRQTLKNQFELPIFFYFLVSAIMAIDAVSRIDVFFAWSFVVSRYIHCYIRLTTNYVPHRAKLFKLGLLILIVWWIQFLISI
tara:strand:- start:274 stop:684 length:411 start_codon:yes stop_codon:yes gene_type:complete